jgi:hypothetical protein
MKKFMQHIPRLSHVANGLSRSTRLLLVASLSLIGSQAYGQQSYVGRYDVYAGYMYLNSPHISLGEPGFHLQVGFRPSTWYSLGFDYSISAGDTALTPALLTTALQTQLGGELGQLVQAGQIPASYSLKVPISSNTQTFSAGPQLSYRHFKAVTLFIRPDLGAMREVATPHPTDPISTLVVSQVAPTGRKLDWVAFYGFGGGVDINIGKHYSLRVQADLVHDHLFNDLLKDSRNTVRFAIGPGAQWGKNVQK